MKLPRILRKTRLRQKNCETAFESDPIIVISQGESIVECRKCGPSSARTSPQNKNSFMKRSIRTRASFFPPFFPVQVVIPSRVDVRSMPPAPSRPPAVVVLYDSGRLQLRFLPRGRRRRPLQLDGRTDRIFALPLELLLRRQCDQVGPGGGDAGLLLLVRIADPSRRKALSACRFVSL